MLHCTIGVCRLARKFLYVVAGLIVLAIAAGVAYNLFAVSLMRQAMVPSARFVAQPATAKGAYTKPAMWLARPDLRGNPAEWLPSGIAPVTDRPAAVFFIHPTSSFDRAQWNTPIDNREASDRAALFLQGQASAFNASGDVWAPRYRQATFGAFLTTRDDAQKALDLAYGDVLTAFDAFLAEAGERPIVLAGHSQGALHLTRLLKDRVAGQPLAKRIVAAYVVGWPISRDTDLASLGLPECTAPDQPGCILSWQSFGDPADPALILDTFDDTTGFDGRSRKGTAMVCTNPITGKAGGNAPASANLGTLFPAADLKTATLTAGQVEARCEGRGLLMIGSPPNLGQYVLPGNNYHVFDYSLFWSNVRADVARRLAAFQSR